MKKNYDLIEDFSVAEAFGSGTIDREKGILRGVAMLPGNKITANKNIYTDKAIAEAVKRYEGAKMFIDHDREKPVRSVRDLGGVYHNVRLEEGKVKGDLHIRPSMKDAIIEIAEMKPAGLGLSIRDKGHGDHKDGVFMVEGFSKGSPFSIDLVSEASSTSSLFEHNNGGNAEEEDTVEKKDITLEWLRKETPNLIEAIQNEGKAAVLKELEESKAKGVQLEESLATAKKEGVKTAKVLALANAGFEKPVYEAVLKVIEPDTITMETANGIITAQKATIEAVKGTKRGKEPIVTGAGARTEHEVIEGKGDLPSEDTILSALTARR